MSLPRTVKTGVGLAAIVFFAGLVSEPFFSIELWAKYSTGTWLLGILVVGVFTLVGEAGFDWLTRRDSATDPLWKRALNLVLLLGFLGCMLAIGRFVSAAVSR